MALPAYLSWTGHGSSCGEPPGVFDGGTMHLFGLSADKAIMQSLVDKFLNPVAGPTFRYTTFVDRALLTMLDIEKGTTAMEAIGWLPGRECALWIPLIEMQLAPLRVRTVMWSPYIFISYAIGMVTGREVWGWSKALGGIAFPAAGSAAPEFSVSTVIFRQFDASQPGGEDRLLKVTGDGPLSTVSDWQSLEDATFALIAKLTGLPLASIKAQFPAMPDFPAIALKQFRDSGTPGLACYQALVNSPIHLRDFAGGGLHTASFQLEVTTCDSHPIIEKLIGGVPSAGSTVVPLLWAAWVKLSFDALAGSVIAKTT